MVSSRILIVDDDPTVRKTLSDILSARGYEAFAAPDGEKGFSLMREKRANVVLLDLGLPDTPGIDLLQRIKAGWPGAEVIIITANATLDSAIEATNRGAFSYLLKPYDVEQLLLHVRRAIEKQLSEEKVIEHSRELEKINAELKAINDVSMSISKTIDMDKLLQEILNSLSGIEVLKIARKGALFLSEGEKLRLFSHVDFPKAALERCKNILPGECLCGKAGANGEIIYAGISGGKFPDTCCNSRQRPSGQIVIPLKAAGRTVGVLSLYNPPGTAVDDQLGHMLSSMGAHIGFAVENARLYEETRTSSLHDPLTGLSNRRFLEFQLERCFETARRYEDGFSVVMADIDHFKIFNDTRGHQEGDKLLVRVAKILEQETRSSDYVYRYGGDEFLMILIKTDETLALKVAEKLRKAVEKMTEITISLGVASYDISVEGGKDLINKADAALYRAKGEGRNRAEVQNGRK